MTMEKNIYDDEDDDIFFAGGGGGCLRSVVIAFIFLLIFIAQALAAHTSVRIATNTLDGVHAYAVHQPKANAVADQFIKIAEGYNGVREHGNNAGPEVNKFLASVGLNPGYSWCMAFAQFCFDAACKALAAKRGDLYHGAAVMQVYNNTRLRATRLPDHRIGERGQMMCFQHGKTALGHVAIVTGNLHNGKLSTIEGNTGPDGGRDGDGVYRKTRPVNGYSTLRTKGFFSFID